MTTELAALAARHGIELEPASLSLNEAGLDFRVGIGRTPGGEHWVLRVPRRADMDEQIRAEAAILELVRSELPVQVPDWKVCTPELVAYPLLDGQPGMTLGANGEPLFRIDVNSRRYAEAFGELLARLHAMDVERARVAGLVVESPAEVRARLERDIAVVAAEFSVAEELKRRWAAWLADDSYWPTWSVMTHGELYPGHVLVDASDAITGVIDWTTAKVSDPGRDFSFQRAMTSPAVFELTVDAYVRAGGKVWPRLSEHAAELWAAGPVAYGLYALQTGIPEHRLAAQAQLAPTH